MVTLWVLTSEVSAAGLLSYAEVNPYSTWLVADSSVFQKMEALVHVMSSAEHSEMMGGVVSTSSVCFAFFAQPANDIALRVRIQRSSMKVAFGLI